MTSQAIIEQQLSGPSRAARLSALEQTLETLIKENDKSIDHDVLRISTLIEQVPCNITEYRERERHLESLLKALKQEEASKSERTQIIALRFLLGSLYINFEKFWGPTIRVIIDIVKQTRFQTKLLELLIIQIKETNDIIYNEIQTPIYEPSPDDRPDYILHRNFILQIVSNFDFYLESHNQTFMNEFFRFVQKELLVSPFIEIHIRDNLTKARVDSSPIVEKRKSRETLLTTTKIFQSFRDAKNIHRGQELKKLLMDLLCCRDLAIQKAAFNCILVFHEEDLKPFHTRILKILSDKMVKTEITLYSLEEEQIDRTKVMPFLLRIIFGKMIGKMGKKSSGKENADHRKTLIMRFISGCTEEEIKQFFQLLFNPIYDYIDEPYDLLESKLNNNFDLENYVPLNKLQAMLVSLSSYMKSVAHVKEELLSHVLKLINIIIFYVTRPLEDQKYLSQITDKNVEALRVLKRSCFNIITDFFNMFQYYEFSKVEINFLFKNLIWNSTQDFVNRNHASPTPLLKLIESFSSNRVYHPLLVKRSQLDNEQYLLHHIIDLYINPKTTRAVNKFISSMLANILDPDRHLEEEEDYLEDGMVIGQNNHSNELPMLIDDDCVIPTFDKANYNLDSELKYNENILIYYIHDIFEILQKNCQTFVDKKDVENKIINDELILISKLSKFLRNPQQSKLAVRLLLTTLAYQKKGDLILNTLRTIQELVKHFDKNDDPTIIPLVGEILSFQRNTDQRKELCNIVQLLSNVDSNLSVVAEALKLLNTTTEDLIDKPDIEKWSQGFQIAFNLIEKFDQININRPEEVRDSILLMIYQTCFIMDNIDKFDFTIRENCSIFYEKLSKKMKLIDKRENANLTKQIIDDILLERFIKKGFRETNDAIKNMFIDVLRSLAYHCNENNKTLEELFMFCNDNQDLDFWINIKHIQLHNRSKALARIITSEKLDEIRPKTLSSYIMPLAGGFLFSKAYKSVSSLVENSIKLIGIICKRLNWITYESTLSYYLGLLTKANATYQKTNIKLITEIIKNFNFDLTSCKEALINEEENKKLEKRMIKRKGPNNQDDSSGIISTNAPSGKKLNPSTARMVYFSVIKKLVPKLESCLHEMTTVEFEHDKNMAGYLPEKDEIKRIPIAYAIVQLLNLLPGRYILFRDHLPTLFIRLSSFLKSKNEDVRKAARATLIKIMSFVGPAYMPDFLRILKQNLDKGFQIHVLNYTIHSVLDSLPLSYGALDNSVNELVNSCFQEIFGKLAEDKEIAQILAKTFEAKKTKSYDTLLILSCHISAEKLDYLMNSIKQILKTSDDPKKVNKLSMCIQKVFTGLAQNDGFPVNELLTFIQTTIEEFIPNLRVREKVDYGVQQEDRKKDQKREDRYLIPKEFSRDKVKSRINEKGNSHMIVENSLRLLLQTFEKNKSTIIKGKQVKQLDSFISLLTTCLKSSSPKCVMRALKCIYFIVRANPDLPTFKLKCNSIVKKIFILLSLYNGVGMVQGDNFEMIEMCFKTLSLLLARCQDSKLNEIQIRALLTYIEQDLHDSNRQTTAFGTLHSLLLKKYQSPELFDIMTKVADLLVTSEEDNVRALSIKIWQVYLLDYKHEGSLLQTYLTRFLRQLDYEHLDGRKSILKMLTVIVTKFPEQLLKDYFDLIFHLLAQRVVNEDFKEVRDIVGKLIGLLLQRLPDKQNLIFNKFIIVWACESNYQLKLLGVKLLSILTESCASILKGKRDKITRILDIIARTLSNKNKKNSNTINGKEEGEGEETNDISTPINDKLNYHLLRLFKRLLDKEFISSIEQAYIEQLGEIWKNIASIRLADSYLPVVITSCQLYLIFIRENDLIFALNVENPTTDNYLEWNAKQIVRTLCDKYIDLLDLAEESEQLLAYITESMIVLGKAVANSKNTLEFERKYKSSFKETSVTDYMLNLNELPNNGIIEERLPYKLSESKKQVDLIWLAIKVVMQARKEAALYRLSKYYRRNFVLSWLAAITQELGSHRIDSYMILFCMTPVRELTDKGSLNPNTKALAEDFLKFIKSFKVQTFNRIYSKLQLHYTSKRVERKKNVLLSRVVNPERGTKRKMVESKNKSLKRNIKKRKEIKTYKS